MSSLIAFVRADAVLDVMVVPGSWTAIPESNRWSSVYPLGRPDGRAFAARLIARQSGTPTHALFVCVGSAAMLTRLANQIAADGLSFTQTWATLGALRADNGTLATQVKAAWPDERPRTNSGTLESPVLTPVGTLVALYARVAGANAEDGET